MSILGREYKDKSEYQKVNPQDVEDFIVTSAEVFVTTFKGRKYPTAICSLYNDEDEEKLSFFETLFNGYVEKDKVIKQVNLKRDNALTQLVKLAEQDFKLSKTYDINVNDLNDALNDLNDLYDLDELEEDLEVEITSSKKDKWTNYSFKLKDEEEEEEDDD